MQTLKHIIRDMYYYVYTLASGTLLGSADMTPSTSVHMFTALACSSLPNILALFVLQQLQQAHMYNSTARTTTFA
jgi:hypothetical protein